jgi:hypothetical protein
MNLSKPGLFNKRFIKTTLIFTFMISTALVVFSRYIYAAPPFLSAQNPPIQNANDQRCADEAAGNDGVIGWSVPLSAVQIVGSNWGEVTYRTYVCNGSNTALTRDVTMTRGRGTIVAAPPAGNGAIGSTDVLDYSQTGWSFSSPWYSQEMGSYSPHSWRYQDVTFRVDGSKFPVSGNYTVQVTGKGVVYTATSQGETGEVSMNIYLTIIKTNPSSCSVTSSPAGNIAPGQNVVLTFQVTNGGNLPGAVDWDTTQYRLGLKPDSAILSQKTVGLTPDAGNMLRMNRTSTSTLSFTAPITVGSYALRWELQNIDGTWHDDILDNCGITLNVGNSPAAFSCSSGFYQIADGSLYSIIPTTAQRAFIANTGLTINAIGYNTLDNYMYGIVRSGASNGNLVRIGVDGSINLLGVVPWSPNVIAGDMDSSGNLWYIPSAGGSTIVRVNVASRAQTSYTLSDSDASETSDLVYIGGALYGIHSISGRVIRIPTSGFIGQTIPTTIYGNSPLSGLINAGPAPYQMTSSWTSSADRMYVFQSDSNAIYEILDYNTPNPSAEVRAPSSPGSYTNTDGASCANAPDPYTANTNYPFLRVQGSDVIAGAVFADNATSCDTRRVAFDPTNTKAKGYIKANGSRSHLYNSADLDGIKSGSSSAQYAAFAYGVIDSGNASNGSSSGNSSSFISNNGYYRSNLFRDILFANTLIGTQQKYGEYYEKESLPCVDISEQQARAASAPIVSTYSELVSAISPGDSQYLRTGGDITLNGIFMPIGRKVTLFVNGKATIAGNVANLGISSGANGVLSTPSLTVIATGGIDIQPNVTYLDGYFLATNNSTLNTCVGGSMIVTSCNSQLRVNGALSATKIEWRRNFGTLGKQADTLPNANNSHCAVASEHEANLVNAASDYNQMVGPLNKCSAEFVNFNPAFYFANPFTTQTGSGVSSRPLNTTELPPIY